MKNQTGTVIYICLSFLVFFMGCYTLGTSASNDATMKYHVLKEYPHDPNAQTEGLVYLNGFLYEGTGPCLNGPSGLRKVDMDTGNILQILELGERLFGEGITIFDDRIIQLTYRAGTGFVYDRATFELQKKFKYPGEGWGLTHDGTYLIISDGTSVLRYLDPVSFKEVKQLQVRDSRGPVRKLNELEFINGEIYANIFETPRIVCILPETGMVSETLNLSLLLDGKFEGPALVNRANGIAYDKETGNLFVTGKYWPNIFEIGQIGVHQ